MNYLVGSILTIAGLIIIAIFNWKLAIGVFLLKLGHLLNRHDKDHDIPENSKQLAKKSKKNFNKMRN